MKLAALALLGVMLAHLAYTSIPSPVSSVDRYAVVHVANHTDSDMSFYRRWNGSRETSQENAQIDWEMAVIPPGQTGTVYFPYDGTTKHSPDLTVVFDSDRDDGEHWQMVRLAPGASADYKDGLSGFTYALEYDNDRLEYASLRAKNGGAVTVLDLWASRPINAERWPSQHW
jgi:hypothetical protein